MTVTVKFMLRTPIRRMNLYEEMRRVAQTVLLAMRSERDPMAALQEETE